MTIDRGEFAQRVRVGVADLNGDLGLEGHSWLPAE
jgi:hypothetical protein